MIDLLSKALITKFKETTGGVHNSLYTLVSGQMFKERAKQKATLPYIVFHIISNVPDYNFGSDFERIRVQFDLFSNDNSSAEVENIKTALLDLYEWQSLTITGYTHLHTRRELARLLRDTVDDNWQYIIDMEVFVEKTT